MNAAPAPRPASPGDDFASDWVRLVELRRVRRGVKEPVFLANLPRALRETVMEGVRESVYRKGSVLRLKGMRASEAHIVAHGCVAERVRTQRLSTLRFHQAGALVGEDDLIAPPMTEPKSEFDLALFSTTVVCLTVTTAYSLSIARLRTLAEVEPIVYRALLASQARRVAEIENIYLNVRNPTLQRVACLLFHLAEWSHPAGGTVARLVVLGPTQSELAEALMLSRASVENALRELRAEGVLSTANRRYTVLRPRALWVAAGAPITASTNIAAERQAGFPYQ